MKRSPARRKPKAKQGKKPLPETPTPVVHTGGRRLLISELCDYLEPYLDKQTVSQVYEAYLFGAEAHKGQRRHSGEPYIYHPLEVARILADMHLDGPSIIAAILHDVIEDTGTAKEQLAEKFGEDVAELVDGVSKIGQIKFSSKEEEQAENFRKMLLAMARDIRVVIIKLADRLHNMRTMSPLSREKQRRIAHETMDIYAPIANRLGVHQWAQELENLAFSTLYPLRYAVLKKTMLKRHGNRKAIVAKVRDAIVGQLKQEKLDAEVTGREKNLYSIYKKMHEKTLTFDQIYDVYAFRISVETVDACYRVLGIIHSLYKPIPGRFKDYIAIPKVNGYQSLHTVVFGPFGLSIELQIRTKDMHRVAEAGVAAHWLYKSGSDDNGQMQQQALRWLQDLLEIQQKAGNPREFLEHLKIDLFPDEVYVFTPNGEIKKLPRGSTIVDFAYDVHTDVGNRCVGGKVNYQLMPLRTQLRNGDHVEIIMSEWGRPSPSWLNYVVTSRARAHIRNFLKTQQSEESVSLGERLLDKATSSMGMELNDVPQKLRKPLLKSLKIKKWDALLEEIGLGERMAEVVARQLVPDAKGVSIENADAVGLNIRGTEGVAVTYGRCCHPIPGDSILGFLSAGRGIVIHTDDCPNVSLFRKRPERWVDVEWEEQTTGVFPVSIRIETRNQRGVLASVAAAISEMDANIDTVNMDDRDGGYTSINFTLEVRDRIHLARIMRRIRALDSVVRLNRMKG
ncbi:MAG: bifunctional GTP diphosphokinase/guanosine-3',5'-bis pyrophosphate 3'-pyrophosphohydrolase [Gammaproteobacteria bacterium]|nr:MAG: bifunctional GTP diphosphokinase/guanosine-3',5'-bis pyrophosphate 3'-pyrophosphohydrolase [Gammaproteobacteria bacterium]